MPSSNPVVLQFPCFGGVILKSFFGCCFGEEGEAITNSRLLPNPLVTTAKPRQINCYAVRRHNFFWQCRQKPEVRCKIGPFGHVLEANWGTLIRFIAIGTGSNKLVNFLTRLAKSVRFGPYRFLAATAESPFPCCFAGGSE